MVSVIDYIIKDLKKYFNNLDIDLVLLFGSLNEVSIYEDYNAVKIYVGNISADEAIKVLEEKRKKTEEILKTYKLISDS